MCFLSMAHLLRCCLTLNLPKLVDIGVGCRGAGIWVVWRSKRRKMILTCLPCMCGMTSFRRGSCTRVTKMERGMEAVRQHLSRCAMLKKHIHTL